MHGAPLALRIGLVVLAGSLLAIPASGEVEIDSDTFGGLQARAIGPAVMGGRIAALDAVWRDGRLTVWIGAATGGVWKSVNGGTTFKPVFDEHTQSIGALTIDRANPDTVWVGTGEAWVRNSVSVGTGIYRTTDGGDSWEHLGLEDSERIVEILVHPDDGDRVYACVTGHLWDANEQRGVYLTEDAGKTWTPVLQVDGDTGCADLALDPQEPRILYASMWQFRRQPWTFSSGGPGSGLYKSTDGGATWRKLSAGLPAGTLGRIAVAPAPSRPSVVYATVESEKTGLYRSEDLGESWSWAGTTNAVESRPFYFSLLLVDPTDHKRVYKPAGSLAVSSDAGQTWDGLAGGTHADHHALWIDPYNVHHLLLGTDGGLYESYDRGVNWNFRQSLPISQFYQVSYDMQRPYNVYGGLQDNGTWYGPTATPAGIQNKHWNNIGGGDGFHAYVDRADPDIVYVEWQGGRMERMRKSTGERKSIQPLERKGDPKYRFNWNAAMHVSPTRTDTIYAGAQFVFRSRDRGESWERISPDLTTDDPDKQRQIESGGLTVDNSTAENHCTIYRIAESPLNENLIWAGTDDGNLQITRDGGKNWTNVVGNVPGLPRNTWVTGIDPSPHAEGTAHAVFDGHRTGDKNVYVYRTRDHGATWESLATESVAGYALAIRQDPVNPELLYLGTEFGLYISPDAGAHWARFKGDLPKVGVREIQVHPREHDLILATHGRGIYVLDDVTPLRALNAEVLASKAALLPSRPAEMTIPASIQEFPGDDEFVGRNPFSGAQLSYYLKRRHLFGDLKLELYDAEGNLLSTVPGAKRRGLNRVSWSMRLKPPKVAPAASLVPQFFSFLGPRVPAGTYTVKLIQGKDSYEGTLELVPDPRGDYSAEDMALQDRTVMALYRLVERLTFLVDRINDLHDQAGARAAGLGERDRLGLRLRDLATRLDELRKSLVATRKGGFLAGEEQLRERLSSLYGAVNGYEGRPTDSQIEYLAVLESELADAERKFRALLGADLESLNAQLRRKNLEPLVELSRADWEARQQ